MQRAQVSERDAHAPERTMGASITPFLKLSEVRCVSIFCFFDGRGDDGGEEELARRDIIKRVKYKVGDDQRAE